MSKTNILGFVCQTCLFLYFLFMGSLIAEERQVVKIVYLTQEKKVPAALSNLDPYIKDKGIQGARLAIIDNNTTGQFTGQHYILKEESVPVGGDIVAAYRTLASNGYSLVVANVSASQLKQLAQIESADSRLIFDVGTRDDDLRLKYCNPQILHLLPSRAMRADALAQYMLKKRWTNWFLVIGPDESDRLFARAIKRAAKRFGMKVVAEKTWEHTFDARRTAQSDVPVFTQGEDYDVLVVADEAGLFGEYLDYRTWLPRPVIGSQGLIPVSWHKSHEQWGAVQIQNRFREQTGRWMEEEDYGAYLAVRSIGEAVTRTSAVDPESLKEYILSDQFVLQGYKGRALSFRKWNGQLRQPVLLAAPRSMVAVAPIEGFLHPLTELDTLGFDQPESQCQ